MIEKERLEELIKEKSTIYAITEDEELLEINCEYLHHPKLLSSGELCREWCVAYESDNRTCIFTIDWRNFCNIFETKEDAEFALKYQNITRTETLSLPTFEEFTINDKYNYYGASYFEFGDGYRLIVKSPSEDDDCEFIGIDVNGNCELYHWEESTKANYLEACELCRKLFLGEEV